MDILVSNYSTSAGVSSSQIPATALNPKTAIDDSKSTTTQPKADTLEFSSAAYEKLAQISKQSTATAESASADVQPNANTEQSQGNNQSVENTNQTQTDTQSSTSTNYTSKSTQAEELYQKGKTVEQIAQSLNVDVATVERYLGVS